MSLRSGVALLLVVTAGCTRQSPAPEQANATTTIPAAPAAPAATSRPVDRSHRGVAAPTAALTGLDGRPLMLAAYRGRPLLVNLWATWCAPCIAEMPALDRAAAALDGKVAVVALNQGEDAAKVNAFLAQRPVRHLLPALDASMAVSMALAANLPTTILYDRDGKEVWRSTGDRDWASAEAIRLVGEAAG